MPGLTEPASDLIRGHPGRVRTTTSPGLTEPAPDLIRNDNQPGSAGVSPEPRSQYSPAITDKPSRSNLRRQMLVGRVLRAAGIGMRHPDRAQSQHVGEDVVGQRTAEVRQQRRLLAAGARQRSHRPLHPRIVRIDAGGAGTWFRAWCDLHHREAVPVQVPAQRRQDAGRDRCRPRSATGSAPRRVAEWRSPASRACPSCTPALRSCTSRTPVRPATGPARPTTARSPDRRAAVDFAVGERLAHRRRQIRLAPTRQCGSARSASEMRGDRMRQLDAGIGDQPAPVAGVVSAFARLDRSGRNSWRRASRETPSAARRDRRGPSDAISRSARSRSRCSAHSSRRPAEPVSSPISIRYLALKPSLPRAASTLSHGLHVDGVLALVVGDAAAVPAPIALGQRPGRRGPRATRAPGPGSRRRARKPSTVGSIRRFACARRAGTARSALGCSSSGRKIPWPRTRAASPTPDTARSTASALGVLAFGRHGHAAGQRFAELARIETSAGPAQWLRRASSWL